MKEKILTIGAYPPPMGGAEISQMMLVEGLAKKGYPVEVLPIVVESGKQSLSENPHIHPAIVTPYVLLSRWIGRSKALETRNPFEAKNPWEFLGGLIMRHHQQRLRKTIASLQIPDLTIISPLWHMRDVPKRTPILGIGRGTDIRSLTKNDRFVIRAIDQCDHIICISPSLAHGLQDLGIRRDITVILPSVDTWFIKVSSLPSEERERLRAFYGIGTDEIVFGHVSTHQPVKRVPDIVAAFGIVSGCLPKSKLVIAGEGLDTALVRRNITKLGLGNRVIFLGMIENKDLPRIYDLFDVFVMASESEGLGRVVLEAQSRCVPVITSNIPGPTDIITDGVNGLVYRAKDAGHLKDAMLRFALDPKLQERLRFGSVEYRSNMMDFDTWIRKHDEIIQGLLKKE